MKLSVDVDRCVGAGVCAMAAPAVFDQNDDDGIVVVLQGDPPPSEAEAVRDAASRCPAAVIRLIEP